LLLGLCLRSSNDSRCIRIAEPTSGLAILLTRCLSTADTIASSSNLSAACGAAIGVAHAATGDKLRAVTSSDVLGASVVRRDLCERSGGNCEQVSMVKR